MRIGLFWASLVDMKEGYCTNNAFSLVMALIGFHCTYRIIKRGDEKSQNVGQESHWEVRSRREKQKHGRLVKEGGPQQEIWRMKTLPTCRGEEASRPDDKQGSRLAFALNTLFLFLTPCFCAGFFRSCSLGVFLSFFLSLTIICPTAHACSYF